MNATNHWTLLRPLLSDAAEGRIDAECGGGWWRAQIVQQGGGLFTVNPKCSNVVGDPILLDFDLTGGLLHNADWDRLRPGRTT